MTYRIEGSDDERYLGFEIRESDGWFVGVLLRAQRSRVLEAETRAVLELKIRRWWVNSQ